MTALNNISVKIDKDIPLPKKKGFGAGRQRIYPWLEMEVDDSFLFQEYLSRGSPYRSVYSANKVYGPRKFVARKTAEGIRCWRVK